MKRILLTVLFVLTLVCQVCGATYYVSNSASNGYQIGNDSNTTVQAQNKATPWLTLQRANDAASNGDTIYINVGTYVEDHTSLHCLRVTKTLTWTSDNGTVTIQANAAGTRVVYINSTVGNTSTFNGPFIIDAQGSKATGLDLHSSFSGGVWNTVTIQNATDVNSYANGGTWTNCSFIQGNGVTTSVLSAKSGTFVNPVITCTSGNITKIIDYTGNGGITLTSPTFNISTSYNYLLYAAYSQNPGGSITVTGATGTISGACITAANPGMHISSPGVYTVSISSCNLSFTNATTPNYLVKLTNQLSPNFSSNTITSTTTSQCIHLGLASTGTDCGTATVSGNIFSSRSTSNYIVLVGTENTSAGDNKLNGMQFTGNTLYGCLYFDPTATTATTHGILIGFNLNATVSGNYFNGCPYGVVLKHNGSSYSSGGVFKNLLIDCANYTAVYCKGAGGVSIYNNSIYFGAGWSQSYYGIEITQNGAGQTAPNCLVKNNIIYDAATSGSCLALIYVGNDGSDVGFVSDYNCLKRVTGTTIGNIGGADKTWAQWILLQDANSKNANPLFTNTGAGNFRLLPGSPCINVGLAAALPATDYEGKVWISPDIGAYAFRSTGFFGF